MSRSNRLAPEGEIVKCSRVGWMGNLVSSRRCDKCDVKTTERYKIYRQALDHYRLGYDKYTGVYCRDCAEGIMTLENLHRLVE
jgi:hypothetical protein